MKIVKKINNIILSLVLIICLFTPINKTEAKTLGDLKRELNNTIADYNENKNKKDLTEKQINNIKNNIGTITAQINTNQETITRLTGEIGQLEVDIQKREEEIKEIMNFYQLSQGESSYLEYMFGASDFTDFIYRSAIAEQLLSYNDDLIAKQNQTIKDNKKAQEDLKAQEEELKNKQEQLNTQLKSLGNQLSEIIDLRVDIEEEIKTRKAAIEVYEKQYGCKDTDEISVCTASKLPADTQFWRPLTAGHATSEYGYRTYNLNGKVVSDFHTGIDLTVSPSSDVPVYSAAAGVVIGIVERASCGGNKIYIHHNINGKMYTTAYVHLRKILVKPGDVVTKDTQIAVMGGDPRIETWDGCSTGAHLHFTIANGLYLKDYTSWDTFVSKTFNPRTIVNFPSGGQSFYNRTTKY